MRLRNVGGMKWWGGNNRSRSSLGQADWLEPDDVVGLVTSVDNDDGDGPATGSEELRAWDEAWVVFVLGRILTDLTREEEEEEEEEPVSMIRYEDDDDEDEVDDDVEDSVSVDVDADASTSEVAPPSATTADRGFVSGGEDVSPTSEEFPSHYDIVFNDDDDDDGGGDGDGEGGCAAVVAAWTGSLDVPPSAMTGSGRSFAFAYACLSCLIVFLASWVFASHTPDGVVVGDFDEAAEL